MWWRFLLAIRLLIGAGRILSNTFGCMACLFARWVLWSCCTDTLKHRFVLTPIVLSCMLHPQCLCVHIGQNRWLFVLLLCRSSFLTCMLLWMIRGVGRWGNSFGRSRGLYVRCFVVAILVCLGCLLISSTSHICIGWHLTIWQSIQFGHVEKMMGRRKYLLLYSLSTWRICATYSRGYILWLLLTCMFCDSRCGLGLVRAFLVQRLEFPLVWGCNGKRVVTSRWSKRRVAFSC